MLIVLCEYATLSVVWKHALKFKHKYSLQLKAKQVRLFHLINSRRNRIVLFNNNILLENIQCNTIYIICRAHYKIKMWISGLRCSSHLPFPLAHCSNPQQTAQHNGLQLLHWDALNTWGGDGQETHAGASETCHGTACPGWNDHYLVLTRLHGARPHPVLMVMANCGPAPTNPVVTLTEGISSHWAGMRRPLGLMVLAARNRLERADHRTVVGSVYHA